MKIIFLFLTYSFLMSVLTIPILKGLGNKQGLLDIAGNDILKIHKRPVSYLGGFSFFIPFVFSLLILAPLKKDWYSEMVWLGCCGTLPFFIGLYDDINGLTPHWRLIVEVVAGFILFLLFRNQLIGQNGANFFFIPIVIFYVVGAINSVNMEDGIDGLAGGLGLLTFVGFMILSVINKYNMGVVISTIMTGALLGFLIFNFHSASIFMGDNGSYFLGFMLAFLALNFTHLDNWQMLLGPILIIGIPVFDAIYAILRRLKRGVSPFHGDRSHFYDQLMQSGLSIKKTVSVCWGLQTLLVVLGILIYTI